MLAIIIPYYQKQQGLLRKAVESVLQQDCDADFRIVVVDDSSPVSAHAELQPLLASQGDRVSILTQANAGPAAARNCGLDSLGPEVTHVAFIDSDDAWSPGHLQRMTEAFDAGADFFFSDYQRPNEGRSCFGKCRLSPSAHRPIDGQDRLYWYSGDFFDALLKGSPAGTSTIGYHFAAMRELRFATELWVCEDILFWMQIAKRSGRIAFSDVCAAQYGIGVNIFEGASWGTMARLKRSLGHVAYHLDVERMFEMSAPQREWNRRFMRQLDDDFAHGTLAYALRGKPGWMQVLKAYSKKRPHVLQRFPGAFVGMLAAKLKPATTASS